MCFFISVHLPTHRHMHTHTHIYIYLKSVGNHTHTHTHTHACSSFTPTHRYHLVYILLGQSHLTILTQESLKQVIYELTENSNIIEQTFNNLASS